MKTNEAPEKIYLCPSELAGIDYDEEWYDSPFGDSIEYTRTDAFIEKACNAYCNTCGNSRCSGIGCAKLSTFKEQLNDRL